MVNVGIRMSFANFRANMIVGPFADMACREFNVLYEERIHGCQMGLYAGIGVWSQFGEELTFR